MFQSLAGSAVRSDRQRSDSRSRRRSCFNPLQGVRYVQTRMQVLQPSNFVSIPCRECGTFRHNWKSRHAVRSDVSIPCRECGTFRPRSTDSLGRLPMFQSLAGSAVRSDAWITNIIKHKELEPTIRAPEPKDRSETMHASIRTTCTPFYLVNQYRNICEHHQGLP